MRIEHIAMYVNDIENAKNFLLNILKQIPVTVITIKRRIFVLIFDFR